MPNYELSVFFRLISGDIVMDVFTIQVDQHLAWVKEHADDLAQSRYTGVVRNYCALMVKEVA